MKRALIAVLVVTGALVLAFTMIANLYPDWTWKTLNAARNIAAGLHGKRASKVELSKYAPSRGDSLKAEQVTCSSPPKGTLYTIGVHTPPDEVCSQRTGDLSLNNYGSVANPLRGWIGCIDGHDLQGVHVDALGSEGKDQVASTITNTRGRFIFPSLKAGTYHLIVSAKGLSRVDAAVTTSRKSDSTLCIVTAATVE
jgi:hypothetical protein